MKRNPLRLDGVTDTDTAAADATVTESPDEEGSRRVDRRRALLTGGAVVAVGAGAAMAATAAPASASTGNAILQSTTNTATANDPSTVIAASSSSNVNPTLVLTNTGSPGSSQASPPLRITPGATGLTEPAATGYAAGDVTATDDGNLWFAHKNGTSTPILATVHTDATSNSFMPLNAPYRILDTRSSGGRTHILNPSGNLNSSGMLLAGHTINIDLTSLVIYGDGVTSNLSILDPQGNGWTLIWPGVGNKPNAASISFSKGVDISNLTVTGISHQYSNSVTDSVAITTSTTTHVVLDVGGFYVANFGQVNPTYAAFSSTASSQSAARASQARASLNK